MSGKILYGITFFDGVQLVTRCVVSIPGTTRFLVFDRYADGEEYLVTRREDRKVQHEYQLYEAVQLLEEVSQ